MAFNSNNTAEMALAMTPCFPVLSVSNFKAFGLNSTHQQYHPSPTREFKNLRMCTSRGLNKSSSLPAANRSRRGFEVFCEAVNKEAQEVIGYETEEAVYNVDHEERNVQRIAFAGMPVVIRTKQATSPPTFPPDSGLLMHTSKENVIGNSADYETELGDPRLRFVLEQSKKYKGLVHIKSSYNNRYWVRKRRGKDFLNIIASESDNIEEDQTKQECTLFEPINLGVVGIEGHVCIFRCLGSDNNQAFLALSGGQLSLVARDHTCFEIVEWDKMVIFPKNVTFKDSNGYLSARTIQKLPYLQFASKDIGDLTIGNEVFVNKDGTIRIKSNHFGKFWRRSPNWIWCDAEEKDSFKPDCLFRPVKLGNNVVALRNLGDNQFCKGLTADGKRNCLNVAAPSITKETHLEVVEVVLSREIYNVEYHVEDAKVDIDKEIVMDAFDTLHNLTTETNWSTVKLGYDDSKTSTWNASVSLKLGGEMTFKAGVPFIESSEVKISSEVSQSYEWGVSSTTTKHVEVSSTVVVPPMSKRRVMVVASKGKCYVPFSYDQRDQLASGQYVTVKKHDGLYTGVNYFDFSNKVITVA